MEASKRPRKAQEDGNKNRDNKFTESLDSMTQLS